MKNSKIAAVSMVKNDSDIIELFIKINSRVFDTFFILDHCSTDGTVMIIKALQSKGFKINFTELPAGPYNQSEIVTTAVRNVANLNVFDYIFPIDADEFLSPVSGQNISELVSSSITLDQIGHLPWVTYCPQSDNFYNSQAPLYENFRMRRFEPIQYYKVILGNNFAKDCLIAMGNHNALSQKFGSITPKLIPVPLNHVPVRSKQQIIRKAILGSYAFALKKNRNPGEGYHWDLMAKKIREKNYNLNDRDLLEIALNYAVEEGKVSANDLVVDCLKIGHQGDCIEFKELSDINLLKSFDMEIASLVEKLK